MEYITVVKFSGEIRGLRGSRRQLQNGIHFRLWISDEKLMVKCCIRDG
jgi:hypothetical protein